MSKLKEIMYDISQEAFFLNHSLEAGSKFGLFLKPCDLCGSKPCYMLCPNHPRHYSAEMEISDAVWADSLSDREWVHAQWALDRIRPFFDDEDRRA